MIKQTLLGASLLTLSLSAQAGGWEILPVMGDNYQPKVAVALVGGNTETDDESASTAGIEVSFTCPLLKAPNHDIRQQVSFLQTDEDGTKTQAFELSPHHMFAINDDFSVGFGPSLGVTKVETNAGDDTAFTYGLGASARYNLTDALFIGADVRKVFTQDFEISNNTFDFDSTKATVKIGYQF